MGKCVPTWGGRLNGQEGRGKAGRFAPVWFSLSAFWSDLGAAGARPPLDGIRPWCWRAHDSTLPSAYHASICFMAAAKDFTGCVSPQAERICQCQPLLTTWKFTPNLRHHPTPRRCIDNVGHRLAFGQQFDQDPSNFLNDRHRYGISELAIRLRV